MSKAPKKRPAQLRQVAREVAERLVKTAQQNDPEADAAFDRKQTERDAQLAERLKRHLGKLPSKS